MTVVDAEDLEDAVLIVADRVRQMFRRPDAYRHFSELVEERGLTDRWHDFREAQTRAVLAGWCEENGLQLG